MKCAKCQIVMGSFGWIVTIVMASGQTHTVTVHPRCLADVVGHSSGQRLENLVFSAGWHQPYVSGFQLLRAVGPDQEL